MNDFEGVHIDRRPDVDLVVFDVEFRFIDRHRRVVVGLRFEQVRQAVIPLAHGLIRPSDHPLDTPIRQAGMIQKRRFYPPLCRRILTRKYFLLACLAHHAVGY